MKIPFLVFFYSLLHFRTRILKNRTKQLQIKIDEHTAELTQSKKELEAANNAKAEFIDNVNHQIRTPINGVIDRINT